MNRSMTKKVNDERHAKIDRYLAFVGKVPPVEGSALATTGHASPGARPRRVRLCLERFSESTGEWFHSDQAMVDVSDDGSFSPPREWFSKEGTLRVTVTNAEEGVR